MNYIWCAMVIASFVCAAVNGTVAETTAAIGEGAFAAIETLLSFAGIMCFWCGILKVMEESGASDIIKRMLSPLVNRLFKNAGAKARENIAMNITANLLGMGNAATPAGVKAMEELDRENKNPQKPSYEMCMFTVLNTTAFQLVPTTIMSLRAAAGGDPSSIIVPVWITSLTSVAAAAAAVKLLWGRSG